MSEEKKGIIDMFDRILKEILKKPNIKNSIRIVLNSIDPESSSSLAKNLLWQDTELGFSLASAIPALINSGLTFTDTLLNEIQEKISPDVIQSFSEELLKEIDTEKIVNIKKNINKLFDSLIPKIQETFDIKND